jgi:hypothetical protein
VRGVVIDLGGRVGAVRGVVVDLGGRVSVLRALKAGVARVRAADGGS